MIDEKLVIDDEKIVIIHIPQPTNDGKLVMYDEKFVKKYHLINAMTRKSTLIDEKLVNGGKFEWMRLKTRQW